MKDCRHKNYRYRRQRSHRNRSSRRDETQKRKKGVIIVTADNILIPALPEYVREGIEDHPQHKDQECLSNQIEWKDKVFTVCWWRRPRRRPLLSANTSFPSPSPLFNSKGEVIIDEFLPLLPCIDLLQPSSKFQHIYGHGLPPAT
jgi:hypothetical protein